MANRFKTLGVLVALAIFAPTAHADMASDLLGTWSTAQDVAVQKDGLDISVNDLILSFAPDGTGEAIFEVQVEMEGLPPGLTAFSVDSDFVWTLDGSVLTAGDWSGTVSPRQSNFLSDSLARELQSALPDADDTVLDLLEVKPTTLHARHAEIDRVFELTRPVP